jgi:hypothetical protein
MGIGMPTHDDSMPLTEDLVGELHDALSSALDSIQLRVGHDRMTKVMAIFLQELNDEQES